jgi:hypothetical protein
VDHQVSSTSSLHFSCNNKVNRVYVPDSVYVYEIPSRCNSIRAGRCHALTWEGAERMITYEWHRTPCFHRTDPPPLLVIDALTVLRKALLVQLQFWAYFSFDIFHWESWSIVLTIFEPVEKRRNDTKKNLQTINAMSNWTSCLALLFSRVRVSSAGPRRSHEYCVKIEMSILPSEEAHNSLRSGLTLRLVGSLDRWQS